MLRTDVYDELRERLFAGELRTGQFVSQRELAELLGATMNPVREAIRRLEADGLIKVYPQRGIQVIEAGPKSINDAYDYRLLHETAAIARLVEKGSPEAIARLRGGVRNALDKLEKSPTDAAVRKDVLEDDFNFHRSIVEMMGNEISDLYYSLNAARLRLFRVNLGEPYARLEIAAQEHLAILDAAERRDAEEAHQLITRHINVSREHTLGVRPMT